MNYPMDYHSINDVIEQEKQKEFTDRETELHLFEQLVRLSDPGLRILGFHGSGGVGKTELFTKYKQLSKKWKTPYVSIDGYAQKNVLSILNRIRSQMGIHVASDIFGDFDKSMYLYLRMQDSILDDSILVAEFQKAVRQTSAKEDDAIIGSIQRESVINTLRSEFEENEVEFYLNAETFLTKQLLKSFIRLETKTWVLFIDAYEYLLSIDDWIRDELVRQLPAFFRIVVGGRSPYNYRWQNLRPVFRSIHLLSFGEPETKEFLHRRGINDEGLIREIFSLTEGHPLYLAMSADAKKSNPELKATDFQRDNRFVAIESIVRHVRQSIDDSNVHIALEICSIVRFFNEEVVSHFFENKLPNNFFLHFLTYSFVKRRSYGYSLHDAVWEFLNNEQKQLRPTKYRSMNIQAIAYYNRQIEYADGREWQRFAIEILFHKIAVNPEEGLIFLVDIFNAAEIQYRLDFCEAIIREAQTYKLSLLENWLTLFEARLLNNRDDWETARMKYSSLLKDKALDSEISAYALTGLGRTLYRLGEIARAEKYFKQALQVQEEADRHTQIALLLHHLARTKLAQRKWRSATKYLKECLTKLEEILSNLSKIRLDSSVDIKSLIEREKAAAISSLGTISFEKGAFDQAFNHYSISLEIFRQLNDQQGIARELYRLGWVLQRKGEWDSALDLYQQSRELFLELGAEYWLARTIVKIGDLYILTDRLEEGEAILLECMRLCIKLGAYVGISVVLDSLGTLYQAQGLYDKAEKMHIKSLKRKEQQAFPFEIELTHMNLGDLKAKQGQFKNAITSYNNSLMLCKKVAYKYEESLVLTKMCKALLDMNGSNAQINDLLKRAYNLSKRYKYQDIRSRVHCIQGKKLVEEKNFADAKNEYSKALRYSKIYNEYLYREMIEHLRNILSRPDLPEDFDFWIRKILPSS